MYNRIILRNGEIAVKKRNRGDFERALIKDIKFKLKEYNELLIKKNNGRIEIFLKENNPFKIIENIENIFGIVSMSPAFSTGGGYENFEKLGLQILKEEILKELGNEKASFKVTVKRQNKDYNKTSIEMAEDIGELILKNSNNQLYVDVNNPKYEIFMEFRDTENIAYTKKIKGAGGMPRGINGKSMVLISGGIDSPVATYLMARRGLLIEGVHFHSYPFTNENSKQKVKDLIKELSFYTGKIKLHMVNILDIQRTLKENCPEKYMTILSRRFMMRIAEKLAVENECNSLITGESLGQVASQTSLGLKCTDNVVTKMPVFRPLIAMDKESIIDISKKIGTYNISIINEIDSCTVFLPKNPATMPNLEKVLKCEEVLEVDKLVNDAINKSETIEIFNE